MSASGFPEGEAVGTADTATPGAMPCLAGAFWVFAYGSLMWDPGFPYGDCRKARLNGYHRRFCVYSIRYRGTPESPGLVLGLDRGGCCTGVAYRVAAADSEAVRAYLWEREMFTHTYQPRLVPVRLEDGARVRALTFVVDRSMPQYTGRLPLAEVARLIAQGHGSRGPCRDYLLNTVRHLNDLGLPSPPLTDLAGAFDAAAPGGAGRGGEGARG
jgi:cation transport protein ChaC